jgi:hypothetical protein
MVRRFRIRKSTRRCPRAHAKKSSASQLREQEVWESREAAQPSPRTIYCALRNTRLESALLPRTERRIISAVVQNETVAWWLAALSVGS